MKIQSYNNKQNIGKYFDLEYDGVGNTYSGEGLTALDGSQTVSASFTGKATAIYNGSVVDLTNNGNGGVTITDHVPKELWVGLNLGKSNGDGTYTLGDHQLIMSKEGQLYDKVTGDYYSAYNSRSIAGSEYNESVTNATTSLPKTAPNNQSNYTGPSQEEIAEGDYQDSLTEQKDFEQHQTEKPQATPPTSDKLAASAAGDHLLQSGDTLWGFAEQSSQGEGEFHSVATLALLNGLTLTADGHVAESFMAGVDSVDIDVNLGEVTAAKTSVDKVIEKIDELETNFNSLLSLYLQAYKTDSLPTEIEGIANEFSKNITVLKEDACAYSAWLNKVQESMTYDASNAGNMMGDPTIIAEITR